MRKFATWLLLAVAAAAPAQLAQGIEAKLDEIFKPWDKTDAPGGVVSVSVKGKLVYARGLGMANLESNTPVTVDTVFDVGSVSKQFTAACVMLLQNDGKLKIDDQASDYLPDYPVLREHKITIRQLMSHTSGLRDYMSLMVFKTGGFYFGEPDVAKVLQGQRTLNFLSGRNWDYSNSGYYLLKKIVEKLSEMSLAEFSRERMFKPLGMKDTLFLDDPMKLIPKRAFGYVRADDEYKAGITMVAADGAGGLWTTLADMHRWTENWKHNKLGSDPGMFKKMQVKSKLTNDQEVGYGLGFFIDEYKSVPRIQHGGDFIGFHSYVGWYPEQDIVVFTASNDGTQLAKSLNDKAAELLLGGAIAQPAAEETSEVTLSETELDEYTGSYSIATSVAEVRREGKQLKVQVTGQPEVDVYASEKDKFFYKVVEAKIEFTRGEDGKVESLTFFQSGQTIKCPRAKPFVMPDERLDALVGHYYSTELDLILNIKRKEDGLYVYSSSIMNDLKLTPVSLRTLNVGALLLLDIDVQDDVVTGLRVNMSRARNMKFARMAAESD